LRTPFRQVAVFKDGQRVVLKRPVPKWLKPLLPWNVRTAIALTICFICSDASCVPKGFGQPVVA
jgi:hypothetical protein